MDLGLGNGCTPRLTRSDPAFYLPFSRMAKRKTPKNSEQPELALDAPAEDTKETKAESEGSSSSLVPAKNGEGEELTVATAPMRKKGAKVQDDEAPLAQSYRNWFLEYASYVILDRAVPHIDDGLKPVQRRILHTLWDMDDGRFHKVANVVGATMRLHPHGDASIGAALVGIGQRGVHRSSRRETSATC